MKNYTYTALISQTDQDVFHEKLAKRIDEYQQKGLEVEVQYQPIATMPPIYSALILAFWKERTQ